MWLIFPLIISGEKLYVHSEVLTLTFPPFTLSVQTATFVDNSGRGRWKGCGASFFHILMRKLLPALISFTGFFSELQVYLLPFQWLRFMHQIRALKPLVNRSHVTNSMYTQIQKNLIRQSLKAYIVKRKEEITTAQVITQLNQVHTLIWSDHTYSVLEVLIYLRRIFVF